jgi:hypothetical protein
MLEGESILPSCTLCSQPNVVSIYKNPYVFLSAKVIQKMIFNLLTKNRVEKEVLSHVEIHKPRYTKEELAAILGITIKDLAKFNYRTVPSALIHKINLPLIQLYCKTRFRKAEIRIEQQQYYCKKFCIDSYNKK